MPTLSGSRDVREKKTHPAFTVRSASISAEREGESWSRAGATARTRQRESSGLEAPCTAVLAVHRWGASAKGPVGLDTSLKMPPAGRREPFSGSYKGTMCVSSEPVRIHTPFSNHRF